MSPVHPLVLDRFSGNSVPYYNGLAMHPRQDVMRWHPDTRGFGFQADIICMLLDQGATYLEVDVEAVNRTESGALNFGNISSVAHTLLDILIRRVANWFYRR